METKGLEGGCLQALSALAMTRMYYDGSMDDRSALIEEQRILDKSQGFLKKRQVLAALMEMKIGGMKGALIALPRGARGTPSRGWSLRRPEPPQKSNSSKLRSRCARAYAPESRS